MAPILSKPPSSGDQCILIVLLGRTHFADDVSHAMKEEINKVFESELADFSPTFVPVTDVEKGVHGVDGTLTDVYAIAKEARRLGWSSLVIVDALSTRQLSKSTRYGECRQLTAMVVYLQFMENDWRPHNSSVFVRRLALAKACREAGNPTAEKWTDMISRGSSDNYRASLFDIMTRGIYLSDPNKSPFMDDDMQDETQRVIHKALDESGPALPSEIKMLIERGISEESPLTDLTDSPADSSFERGHLRIQSLIHLTPEQLQRAQKEGEEAAKRAGFEGSVQVYQWKQHTPCSRRDIARLFVRYLGANRERGIYSMLISCPEPSKQASIQFGWARDHQYQELLLATGSADDLVRRWIGGDDYVKAHEARQELFNHDESLSESASVETLFDPANTFPPETALWKMPDHSEDRNGISAPPVFYLTKDLSKSESKAILDALQELDDSDADYNVEGGREGQKHYSFVPWEKEDDGTVEDMFKLLWHMRNFRGGSGQPSECIFVDKQTAQDGTVILADAR